MTVHVAFAGVGGQGILSAARLLGEACHRSGLCVTIAELHGMSQRGGAVQTTVSIGDTGGAGGSLSPEGERLDVLVGLELVETARLAPRLRADSTVVCNRWLVPPQRSVLMRRPVPKADVIVAELRRLTEILVLIDANGLAEQAGAQTGANLVLLGALAALPACPVSPEALLDVIRDFGRDADRTARERAFSLGMAAGQDRSGGHRTATSG